MKCWGDACQKKDAGGKLLNPRDEISSTEKLLDLIRDPSPSDKRPPSAPRTRKGRILPFHFSAPVTVGIEITDIEICLVKIKQVSVNNLELLDFCRVPLPPALSRTSPPFGALLKTTLHSFCGELGSVKIWCVLSSPSVDIRYLKIPKVARDQVSNAVYWTYKKEAPFQDAESLFNYQIIGETSENGTPKMEVIAYTAPRNEIDTLQRLFDEAGFDLAGITPLSFSIQNLLRTYRPERPTDTACSLWIGMEWSCIDLFSDGKLVLSRSIRAGMNSMIEAIKDELVATDREIYPEGLQMETEPVSDGRTTQANEEAIQAREVLFGILDPQVTPPKGPRRYFETDVFEVIRPVLQRLVKQVERTLKHYSLHYDNAVIGKIYISGPLGSYSPLVNYVARQLEIPIVTVNPYDNALKLSASVPAPPNPYEQAFLAVAVGTALCVNPVSPNLLRTHSDQSRMDQAQRINRRVWTVFLCLLCLLGALSFWQDHQIRQKRIVASELRQQFDGYAPRVDRDLILQQVSQLKTAENALTAHSAKLLTVAIVSELASLTPDNIRLVSISSDLSIPTDKQGKKSARTLLMDGVVFGNRRMLDTVLAGYLIRLKNSPLFGNFSIPSRRYETLNGLEVLRFTGELTLEGV